MKILLVAGARPNFMKIAPIVGQLRRQPDRFTPVICHTGQHYDAAMSEIFFRQLGIPEPDIDLNVGSGSHAQQTAAVIARFEPVVLDARPDLVMVVGDVNSTVACALVASKLGIAVAHVEAGLRSFDRTMPEEINRVLTDQISDLLFITERAAEENLAREGIARAKVHFVGNVMIDTLLANLEKARTQAPLASLGLTAGGYALLTLHRPSNVDDPQRLAGLFDVLEEIHQRIPVVFPVHPRTRASIETRLGGRVPRLQMTDPLGYLDFLGLMADARLVLTDSGGIQEETTALGVRCLTMRDNTERPVTVEHGTNRLVGSDPAVIRAEAHKILDGETRAARIPDKWDGRAAERIVEILLRDLAS